MQKLSFLVDGQIMTIDEAEYIALKAFPGSIGIGGNCPEHKLELGTIWPGITEPNHKLHIVGNIVIPKRVRYIQPKSK